MSLVNVPIKLFKQDKENVTGRDALKLNITAIKALAEAIKTTFGPEGLNKLIVDPLGDLTVTNDGAKILEEMSISNPTAKMVVNLAKTIHKDVGDGAVSSVLFIGELMAKVEEMIDLNLSPAVIHKGFSLALKELQKQLDKVGIEIDVEDKEQLKKVIRTALATRNLAGANEVFANLITDAAVIVKEKRDGKCTVDLDDVQIIKKEGADLEESILVKGIIVDKEVVSPVMPKEIKNPKIALIDHALEIVKTDYSAEIQITDPTQIEEFLAQEQEIVKKMIDKIKQAGANVVFCQKGIDETAQHFLIKNNIMAIRRVKHSDMKKLSHATGAKIITDLNTLKSEDLGSAGLVMEKKIGNDKMIFIEDCPNPRSATILVRGASEQILDEGKRTIENGLRIAQAILRKPYIVGGAGSIEIELRKRLLSYAQKIGGKEQIAIERYADALEIIPKTLIENSGMDPLDIITQLRAKTDYEKKQYMGYNVLNSKLIDTIKEEIIEPSEIKKHIFTIASELALILIRVDNYIKTKS